MSHKLPLQRRPSGRRAALWAIVAMLAATACFVGCATEVSALGREHQAPAAALVAAAAAFAVAAVVLVRVAIRLEHRVRSAGVTARAATPATRQPPAWRVPNSPATRIAGIVIIAIVVAGLAALTVSLHAQGARSAYTQQHGLARRATIEAVVPVSHATSTQAWTTYDYEVALAEPAGPVTRTIAHDPSRNLQQFGRGDTIRVLVDPRQPDYSELPGSPVESSAWFAGPLVLAVIFAGLAALITTEEIRHRRQRAAAARGPGTPEQAAPELGAPVPGAPELGAPGPGAPAPGARSGMRRRPSSPRRGWRAG